VRNRELKCGDWICHPCKGYPDQYAVTLDFANNNLTGNFGTSATHTVNCLVPNGTYILQRTHLSISNPYATYFLHQNITNPVTPPLGSGQIVFQLNFCGGSFTAGFGSTGGNQFGNPVFSIAVSVSTFFIPGFIVCGIFDNYIYNQPFYIPPTCSGITTLALQNCCFRGQGCSTALGGVTPTPPFSSLNGQGCSCQVPTTVQLFPI